MRENKYRYQSDDQIMKLIEILKQHDIIRFDTDFCRAIDMTKQHLRNVKNMQGHFTPEHIKNIVWNFKVNANWIFGASDKVFLKDLRSSFAANKIANNYDPLIKSGQKA